MTYLHIGLHKTGTTSLQAFLRDHEQLLAEHGWSFPNGWLQLNCHFELGLALLNLNRVTPCRMRGLDWMDPNWRLDVIAQVRHYLDQHPKTIISCEELSYFRHDEELERLREVVGDAEVIVYLRDPDEWLAAMRDEVSQYADFSDDPDAFNYLERDSWQLDYEQRLDTWSRYFALNVHSYDRMVEWDGSIIPSFCDRLEIELPDDVYRYWLNRRGTKWDGRVPGTRWSGGRFGDPVRPTTAWLSEYLRRGGYRRAA